MSISVSLLTDANLTMRFFVKPGSIVRQIWGDADVILLVFAGSAAEFALNRAVDWLFLPANCPPIRLPACFRRFATRRKLSFNQMPKLGRPLLEWILFMLAWNKNGAIRFQTGLIGTYSICLIDYSERAYEMLHRPLTNAEREELFHTFREVGAGMHVPDLPTTYENWRIDREAHLNRDLIRSEFTDKLFQRYREQLGNWRYDLLRQVQSMLVPEQVSRLLALSKRPLLTYSLSLYGMLSALGLRSLVQRILLPTEYLDQIRALDIDRT